jgi:hypothetical protein
VTTGHPEVGATAPASQAFQGVIGWEEGILQFAPLAHHGTRSPTGLAVYLRIRPTVMRMGHEMIKQPMAPNDSMPGMLHRDPEN